MSRYKTSCLRYMVVKHAILRLKVFISFHYSLCNSHVEYYVTHKGKGKGHPRSCHEGSMREYKYSSTLSLTTELDRVGDKRHAPATLPPENTRYSSYRWLGGSQDRSELVRKSLAPTGIRSPDRPARSESLHRLSYPALCY